MKTAPAAGSRSAAGDNAFSAVFDGNGYAIRHLGIRRDQNFIGLFGGLGSAAVVRNLGLIANLADSLSSDASVGGLAGQQSGGSIVASYATGPVAVGSESLNDIGGLVGYQEGGSIVASYATGPVAAGSGSNINAGGLVGSRVDGSITASYATGPVVGDGSSHSAGGLVGSQDGGSITASYATGPVAGDGSLHSGGGLVGFQGGGSITASYATGPVQGVAGGSLGAALVGVQNGGLLTASYGFGAVAGGPTNLLGTPPAEVSVAADLTLALAGTSWSAAANRSQGAWDFGSASQLPVLKYADYDGAGAVFDCAQFPRCLRHAAARAGGARHRPLRVFERGVRPPGPPQRQRGRSRSDQFLALAATSGPGRHPERRRQQQREFHRAGAGGLPRLRGDRHGRRRQ